MRPADPPSVTVTSGSSSSTGRHGPSRGRNELADAISELVEVRLEDKGGRAGGQSPFPPLVESRIHDHHRERRPSADVRDYGGVGYASRGNVEHDEFGSRDVD